jgi:hypothetical protein
MLHIQHSIQEELMYGLPFWKRTGLVVAAAVAINVVVYLVATALGGDILVPQGGSTAPLSVMAVIAVTALPLVLAAVLLLVLRRVGVSSPRVFATIVAIVTVLSLLAPLTAGLSTASALVLSTMHLVAGLAALVGLTPLYRTASAQAPTLEASNV